MSKVNNIKLGAIVMTPVTDTEGEVSYVYGVLVDINSRFAKVSIDGQEIRVGKSKIELVSNPGDEMFCPKCNSAEISSYKNAIEDGLDNVDDWTHEHRCLSCEHNFGKEVNVIKSSEHMSEKLSERNYTKVKAHSGRASLDCNDNVAVLLRGQSLDKCYEIASDVLDQSIAKLKTKYAHLNPGQQRMCLGNRMRSRK